MYSPKEKSRARNHPPTRPYIRAVFFAATSLAGFAFFVGVTYAASFTTGNSGFWNIGTTWGNGCASSCTQGTQYPGPADTAAIAGKTVTLNANQSVGSTTLSATGILSFSTFALNVFNNFINLGTVNGAAGSINFVGASQYVTGTSTFSNLTKAATSSSGMIFFGLNQTTINGTLTLTGTATDTLTVRGGEMSYITSVGSAWTATGTLSVPNKIAVDSSGNSYVTQINSNFHTPIQKFDSSGNPVLGMGYGSGTAGGVFLANTSPGQPAYATSTGWLYVPDGGNNRIHIFDESGNFIKTFGWGVATGASSSEICTSSCKAGFATSSAGAFNNPSAVVIDGSGNIYVVDRGNNRIEKLDSSLNFLMQWGSNATSTGNFTTANAVAVDNTNGYVYVSDANNNWPRIEKFDLSGNFIAQIPAFGVIQSAGGNGRFQNPVGVAVDAAGNLYVADSLASLVQKFNSSGVFQLQWGGTGSSTGKFAGINGISVDASGNVYVTDAGNNNRVQKFTSSGVYISSAGIPDGSPGVLAYPTGIAADSLNNIYVAEQNHNRIQMFNSSGAFVRMFGYGVSGLGTGSYQICTQFCITGASGSGNGQFNTPQSLAVDPSNNLYVTDKSNNRIEKFDSASNYVLQWGSLGTGAGQFSAPYGIAVDATNSWVYVTDGGRNRVQKFDLSGNFINMFGWGVADGGNSFEICASSCQAGSSTSGNGGMSSPTGVAVDSSGYVYVVDGGNNRIEKFDSSGNYIAKWGTNGFGPAGQLAGATGIWVDSSAGRVYVSNGSNGRIEVYDTVGNFVHAYGYGVADAALRFEVCLLTCSQGNTSIGQGTTGNGQINTPRQLAMDSLGNLYDTEQPNQGSRVEKFHPLATINPLGPVNAQYLAVKDMFNASTTNITCVDCIDLGGNTGWNFLTLNAPTLSVPTTTAITTTGVTFSDTMTNDGGASSTVIGFNYGLTTGYGSATSTTGTYGVGTFAMSVVGLSCGTTYYYQAFATNSGGTALSSGQSFATNACPLLANLPTMTMGAPTGIATSSATFNGAMTNDGNASSTIRGFNYGTTTTYAQNISMIGTYGVGSFSLSVTGLLCNTLYHVQSYASNAAGTGSSTDTAFNTGACPPTVTVQAASSTSSMGVTLNGNIAADGSASSTVIGFNYGLTSAYGSATSTTGTYSLGAFSLQIAGLACHTLYHYQAFSINAGGIGTSSDQTFVTSICPGALPMGSLSPSGYSITDLNSGQSMAALSDNNATTSVTLSWSSSNNAGFLVDMGTTTAIDRLYFTGTSSLFHDEWPDNTQTFPLGTIDVYVGTTTSTSTMTKVGEFLVPYDQGNPIDLEGDVRFSPTLGRYVRAELRTQFNGCAYWYCGWTNGTTSLNTSLQWKVSEVEVYGFTGSNAYTKQDAVVIPPNASTTLSFAALELSYYLGQLEGKPVPIVTSLSTSTVAAQYPGTIYDIIDLKSLAPDWNTMVANQNNGSLPTEINVERHGNEVDFRAWPYRNVLEGVWAFLQSQGVVWAFPDPHGDYIQTTGINLNVLPITKQKQVIYANWDATAFDPWPQYVTGQSIRQDYLYAWRNGYDFSYNNSYILGGSEIPSQPATGIPLSSDYTEGFSGYPHNFSSVIPQRILNANPIWCGYVIASSSRVCSASGQPAFDLSNSNVINWVVGKMIAVASSTPLNFNSTNFNYLSQVYQLLPLDATLFDQGTSSNLLNSPAQPDPVPYTKNYVNSQSGAYYDFINQIAQQVGAANPNIMVGALAYADVWLAPHDITFPSNVRIEVGLYGSPNLPMSAPANAAVEKNFDYFHSIASNLTTYDWSLLQTDYWQPNPALPLALTAGFVDKAKYLQSIGALTGGVQAYTSSFPYNPWNFYAYTAIRENTSLTEAQINNTFFTSYFKEASTSMLAYYNDMESWQQNNNVNLYLRGYADGITPGSYPLAILAKMQTDLTAAEATAQNWVTVQRIAYIRAGFNYLLLERGLVGADLNDTSPYQGVGADTNPVSLSLANGFAPDQGPYGNFTTISAGGWTFNSQGTVQKTVNFNQGGTYTLQVRSHSDGSPTTMYVYVGPQYLGLMSTSSTSFATSTFTVNISAGYGVQDVTIENSGNGHTLTVSNLTMTRQSYTASVPTVTVQAASSISSTTAVLNGTIINNGNASSTSEGFNFGDNAFYDFATSTSGTYSIGAYSQSVTGLLCASVYHVQAFATNSLGTATSSDLTFTTSSCTTTTIPTVMTSAASGVSTSTVTLNGAVTVIGGASIIQSGFVYGTSSSLINSIATTTLGAQSGTTTLSQTLSTGLIPNTTYYFEAYAVNLIGTSTGSILSFTTNDVTPPAVSVTAPASGVTVAGAAIPLSAVVTDDVGVAGVQFLLDGTTNIGSLLTATSSPSTYTTTWDSTGISMLGSHTLYAVAHDAAGNYATSTVSVNVENTVPGKPTSVSATAGDAQANVSFVAPVDNGGASITGYTVVSNPADGTDLNGGSTALTHTVVGLTNNMAYTFTVTATNANGTGNPSDPSNSVTPVASALPTYAVGGSISGLNGMLVLTDNGGDNLSVSADGLFTFNTEIADGDAYSATVLTQPADRTCAVSNGVGTMSGAAVTNILISCNTGVVTSPASPLVSSGGGGGMAYVPIVSVSIVSPFATITSEHFLLLPTLSQPLALGSNGSEVSILQAILTGLGFFKGPVNGNFGSLTEASVRLYQAANGIASVGYVGPMTRASLNAQQIPVTSNTTTTISTPYQFTRNLTVGSSGTDVQSLQRLLNSLGFIVALSGVGSAGHETTYFGPATQAALVKFQKAHSIVPTSGFFGPLTRSLVNNL